MSRTAVGSEYADKPRAVRYSEDSSASVLMFQLMYSPLDSILSLRGRSSIACRDEASSRKEAMLDCFSSSRCRCRCSTHNPWSRGLRFDQPVLVKFGHTAQRQAAMAKSLPRDFRCLIPCTHEILIPSQNSGNQGDLVMLSFLVISCPHDPEVLSSYWSGFSEKDGFLSYMVFRRIETDRHRLLVFTRGERPTNDDADRR